MSAPTANAMTRCSSRRASKTQQAGDRRNEEESGSPEQEADNKACSAAVNLSIEPRTDGERSLSQPAPRKGSDEIEQKLSKECGHGVWSSPPLTGFMTPVIVVFRSAK